MLVQRSREGCVLCRVELAAYLVDPSTGDGSTDACCNRDRLAEEMSGVAVVSQFRLRQGEVGEDDGSLPVGSRPWEAERGVTKQCFRLAPVTEPDLAGSIEPM
ncbi:MAG TPA: hypothetical protein VG276_25900 [Actinomycetes bacterium]|nr:hypothetical protein [Actinomycetes bacterium]